MSHKELLQLTTSTSKQEPLKQTCNGKNNLVEHKLRVGNILSLDNVVEHRQAIGIVQSQENTVEHRQRMDNVPSQENTVKDRHRVF